MNAPAVTRVVVVGRDAALWLSATAIARALGPAGVAVEAVVLPSRLHAASSYTSLPALEALHAKIGVDEGALLRATGGVFSLGHNFTDVARRTPAFFHAWSAYGAPIDGNAFLPQWTKARRFGLEAALQDFCPAAVAAKYGRMLVPDDETDAFGRVDYAYHLPAGAYIALLVRLAAHLGIARHEATAVGVELAENGAITAVSLDGRRRIAGDLFIDASGEEALLIDTLASVRESWRDHFPADRRLVARGPALPELPAYAEQRAWDGGWVRLQPDQSGTAVVQAYANALTNAEVALRGASAATGLPLGDAVVEAIEPGRRREAWQKNCVAIGGAAAVFDPIHGVDLHAVQLGIVHLLALFPGSTDAAAERAEYNRLLGSLFDRIRDFQSAAYVLAPYDGAFWATARGAVQSAELAHKIATFRARGEVAPMEDETFLADSWQALFTGIGVIPESWPATADLIPPERVKDAFRRMLGFIGTKVHAQPRHADYLDNGYRGGAA